MTEPFALHRRTPAGQLRYLAEQVARTNGLDQDDRTRLAAVRMQLEQLADELEQLSRPEPLRVCMGLNRIGPDLDVCGNASCRCHRVAAEMQALLREMTPEMTAGQSTRLDAETAMSGVDTPGCDCGHDGLGLRWHARDCAWRKEQP